MKIKIMQIVFKKQNDKKVYCIINNYSIKS